MKASASKTVSVAACMLMIGLALSGCREDEQGRTVALGKGQYPGGAPSGLSEAQLDELRLRARNQATRN